MKILFWTGYHNGVFEIMEKIDESSGERTLGFGSEGSLYRLAVSLDKLGHEVYIFGGQGLKNHGYDIRDYDAVIVQRYLNFLIYENSNHPNIILWLHDITPLPWYQGATLSESGKHLYEMAVRNEIIRKTVVLTPFHERKIRSNYDLPEGHFAIIGHGINQKSDTDSLENKIPYRMVWTSDWVRDLKKAIQIINYIPHDEVPISVEVFGEGATDTRNINYYDNQTPTLREVIESSPHEIIIRPKVEDEEIVKAWSKADFWFYPTDFEETYCITALEAQRAGAFCFASNVGSLPDVIQDRGFIYHDGENNEEYYRKLGDVLKHYLLNPNDVGNMREKAITWAKEQTSMKMAKEWEIILREGVQTFKFFD